MAAGLLIPFLLLPAGAEPVQLEWNWSNGRALTYRTLIETTQRAGPDGASVISRQKQVTVIRYQVNRVSPAGLATVEATYESMRLEMDSADQGVLVYDSTEAETGILADHPVIRPAAALVGQSFSMEINRNGEILGLTGFDRLLSHLLGSGSAGAPPGWAIPDDPAMRKQLEAFFRVLPGQPVNPGDRWRRSQTRLDPQLEVGVIRNEFQLEDLEQRDQETQARISFISSASFPTVSTDPAAPGRPEIAPTRGLVYFSLAGGYVVKQTMETLVQTGAEANGSSTSTENTVIVPQQIAQSVVTELIRHEEAPAGAP